MKKLFSSILMFFFIVSLTASALAINILNEHVDVTTPTNKYDYVGRATLIDKTRPGYLILSLSASPDEFHTMLDLLYNTYGSITNIPGLSEFLPRSDYIYIAKWGMKLADDGTE